MSTPRPLDVQSKLYPEGIGKFNDYTLLPGVCVLPLAEDPPTDETELKTYSPVIVARLHAPFRIRKVTYDSKKENNPPAGIPAPADAGAFVFLGGQIGIATMLNTTLCNFDWKVVTSYAFVENCVSRTQDGFVLGSYQAPSQAAADNAKNVGLNLGQPSTSSLSSPGAISQAGNDAKTGYFLGVALASNLFGTWGYNQDSFLPGCLFNDAIVNADLNTVPVVGS